MTNNNLKWNNQDLKQGVYECIEFLKCHATNRRISREKTTAENVWKSQAITKFTKEEITAAYIQASNFDF